MPSTPELAELAEISQYGGRDVLLVQGGGGNSSVKSPDGQRMWIKASGLPLAEVTTLGGYLEMDLEALLGVVRDPDLAARPRAQAHDAAVRRIRDACAVGGQLRPSLETGFHAVLGRVVLHTHPVYANAFSCMNDGYDALAEVLEEPAVWVPYEAPGYALGVAVDVACSAFQRTYGRPPTQVMMENHGLIASTASSAESIAVTEKLVRAGELYFGALPAAACAHATPPAQLVAWAANLERALRKRLPGRSAIARPATRATLLKAAAAPEQWLTAGPLVPDDVVYSGARLWTAAAARTPQAWLAAEMEALPERLIVVVEGLGVVLAGSSVMILAAMEETLLAHVLVRQLIARRRGRARTLPAAEVDYLLSMESEKYRQAVAAGRERTD